MTGRSYRAYRREQARTQRRANDSCVLVLACWLALSFAIAAAWGLA